MTIKRLLVIAAVLLGTVASASADGVHFFWYDTISLTDTIGDTNANSCIDRVGVQYDTRRVW